MLGLFRKKTRLEKLQCRYTWLMRRSYMMALKDKGKSAELHHQAEQLLKEIELLTLSYGDK
jgi:hypothetical protein